MPNRVDRIRCGMTEAAREYVRKRGAVLRQAGLRVEKRYPVASCSVMRARRGNAMVIVKFPAFDNAEWCCAHILREAYALSKSVAIPGIAKNIATYQMSCGFIAIVREYVEGPTLMEWLGGNPCRDALRAVKAAIADTVNALHDVGVCGIDLSECNVIIAKGLAPHIIDLGNAGFRDFMDAEEFLSRTQADRRSLDALIPDTE
jgi:serine/threonine protein kinase